MAAKTKPPRLLDLLRQGLDAPPKSRRRWIDDLSDDVRDQIEEAKSLWQNGELKVSGNRMAEKLVAAMHAMGVSPLPGRTTVHEWLKN